MLYLLVALVVVGLGYFVAWPLLSSDKVEAAASAAPVEAGAMPDFQALERALADVDFDHAAGKIDDEEWQTLRAPIAAQLEDRQEVPTQTLDAPALPDDWELEVLIARARRNRDKKTDRSTNLVS